MKILIAEDDAVARTLIVDILTSAQMGYELLPAEDGMVAWQAAEQNPDLKLALIDLALPGLSGMDLIERLRADPRFASVPVIVCTGNTDRATVAAVAAKGIRNFLVKPFTRTTVLEKVMQVCKPTLAAVPIVRDLSGARQRHEIDRDTHRELLGHYVRVADLWAADARRVTDYPRVRALAIRAPHLRQMMSSLGASAVAARLQEAEQALSVFKTKPLSTDMPNCVRTAQQQGEKLQKEIDRLRDVLDTL